MESSKNKPVRIVMLVTALPPLPAGGAELQALKLATALSKKGIDVRFIMPGRKEARGRIQMEGFVVYRLHSWMNALFSGAAALRKRKLPPVKIEYDDVTEITSEMTRTVGWPSVLYYNIFFIHALWVLWKRRKSFDIIHAHTMEWSAIVASRLGRFLNKPVVIKDSTMNGLMSLKRFPSGKKLQAMVMRSAYFVAMTRTIYENLITAGVDKTRISQIPNGIFIGDRDNKERHPNETPKVLFVGNLYQQPAKGVDILLRAWKIVHAQFPDVVLEIVGDGVSPAYEEYTGRLLIRDAVKFRGKQRNLSAFYREADLFVLPSRREGMPNALMEAMLEGVPSIATDISGCRDIITDRENGMLVPAKDPVQLADRICFMLSNPKPAKLMGEKGRETIITHFDMEGIADKYIVLYTKLLNGISE